MKRIKILLLLFFLATVFNVNAQEKHASKPGNGYENGKGHYSHGNGHGYGHTGKPGVGAPLDGGLLTVLGVAGVGYYVARKKGKKPES